MKVKFRLPKTRMSIVLWYRNGKANKTLIPTPPNNEMLRQRMLEHKVGHGEIRAVESVEEQSLSAAMGPKFSRAH